MPINTVYPLDLSGTAIDNRIVGEAKHIAVDPDRVFIPTGGPFYTKSLRVKRSGVLLTPFTDYKCLELNVDGTLASGKEVCNVILISAAGTDFTIDYQVIGGEYSDLSNELANLIANTPLNQLGVLEWGGIVNKPLKYPPSVHYHFPFEWRGYTGVLAQLEAMRQAIISSDSSSLSAIFTFIQENIHYITSEYLSANALIFIDRNPTPSGNVLLKGDGTQASPLGLDLNELFQEFDLRYLRNVMNPVSRIGAVADYFLPISSGFFNNLMPFTKDLLSQAMAGEVERNGDLVLLLPATDGEAIRYVYGIVKGWTTEPRIDRFKPTNQQYTPPGLAADEAIMDILNCNEQSMFAKIFTVNPDGSFVFKEYCIIWLNGTMYQEKHIIHRMGPTFTMFDGLSPHSANHRGANFFKLSNGTIYLLVTSDNYVLLMYTLDPATNELIQISNWTGYHNKTVLAPAVADLSVETVESNTRTLYKTGQPAIKPFSWYKTQATVDGNGNPTEYWISDNLPPAGPGWRRDISTNADVRVFLRIRIQGNIIHCEYATCHSTYVYDNNTLVCPLRIHVSMALTIQPTVNPPVYDWLRVRSDRVPLSSWGVFVNQDQVNEIINPDTYQVDYKIPSDMVSKGYGFVYDDIVPSSLLGLKDGNVVRIRTPNITGIANLLQSYSPSGHVPENYPIDKLFQPYYFWKWLTYGGGYSELGQSGITLRAPTVNGVNVTCIPLNDRIMLLRETPSRARGGQSMGIKHSLYRPLSSISNYKTPDVGIIQGYTTSADRKEIAHDWAFPVISARLADGTCRFSNLHFHRFYGHGTWGDLGPSIDQVCHRDITANFTNAELQFSNPITLPVAVANAMKAKLFANFPELAPVQLWAWNLIVSPVDIETAFVMFHAKNRNDINGGFIYFPAKITYDVNNVMTDITLGAPFSHTRPDGAYQVDIFEQGYADTRLQWAIQYNEDMTVAEWFGREPGSDSTTWDTVERSAVWRFTQTKDGNGFPQFAVIGGYGDQSTTAGYKTIVSTSRGVGLMTDFVGYGAYRALQTFNLGNWSNGGLFSSDPKFLYFTPRPPAAFNVFVTDRIEVQLGGVQGAIEAGTYSLTDPLYSTITDPSNKTIFVYIVLELGQPRLHFSATALVDTVSVVYIGKIVTDSVGVMQSDLRPVSRIDSYRPSATPQGSSFSVSSGTADMFQRLNWDANIPENDSTPPAALYIKFSETHPYANTQIQNSDVIALTVLDSYDVFWLNMRKINLSNNLPIIPQFNGLPDGILEAIDSSDTIWKEFKSVNWVNSSMGQSTLTWGAARLRIKPTAIITEPITFTLNVTNAGVTSNTVTLTINPPAVTINQPAVVLKFTGNQQNANSPIESPDVIGLTSVNPDATFWMNVRLFNLPDNVPIPVNFAWLSSGLLQYRLNGGPDQWEELLGLNWATGVKPAGVTAYTYSLQLRVNPTTVSDTGGITAQATVNGAVSNSVDLLVLTGDRYLASEWYNTPIVGGGTIDASPYLEERIGNGPFYLGITYRGMPIGAAAQVKFSLSGSEPTSYYQRWNGSAWVDVENGETFTIPTTHTVLTMQQFYTLNVQFRLKPGSDTDLFDLVSCTTTMAGASSWSSLITVKSQA